MGYIRAKIPGKQGTPIQTGEPQTWYETAPLLARKGGGLGELQRLQIKSPMPSPRQTGAEGTVLKVHCITEATINCKGISLTLTTWQLTPLQQGGTAREESLLAAL